MNGYARLPSRWSRGAVKLPTLPGEYPPIELRSAAGLDGGYLFDRPLSPLGVLVTPRGGPPIFDRSPDFVVGSVYRARRR